MTPKKTRTIDVKHFVKEPITARLDGDRVTLTMGIGIYPEGTMKPGDVWQLGREKYGWPVTDGYSIHRHEIMWNGMGVIVPVRCNGISIKKGVCHETNRSQCDG